MTKRSYRKKKNGAQKKAAHPPKPEPTFELSSIAEAFGFNYGLIEDRADPVYFARNALDDARRVLLIAEESLVGDVDRQNLQNLICNAAQRAAVADVVLDRFTLMAEKGKVAS